MIEINNLSFSYVDFDRNRKKVFDNLNYNFYDKSYCIYGDGGSGKTTLIKILMGVNKGVTGSIRVDKDGEKINILSKSGRRIINEIFGVVPHPVELHFITSGVFDELLLSFRKRIIKREIISESINDIISFLRLNDEKMMKIRFFYNRLVNCGCAIVNSPNYLLLDEPLLLLDRKRIELMKSVLLKIKNEMKINLFIFTHSYHLVKDLVEECVTLKDGKLL